MKISLKKLLISVASAGLLISGFAAPAHATSEYTGTVDCSTFAGDGLDWEIPVEVVPGGTLDLTFVNCPNLQINGGTQGAYRFTVTSVTGDATLNVVSPSLWNATLGASGTGVFTGHVVTNLNESYNLDWPTEYGHYLLYFDFESWTYMPILAEPQSVDPEPTPTGGKLGKINFGPNSPVLSAAAMKKLRAIGKAAIDADAETLKLKGFTSVGIDASWTTAQHKALSKARAKAAKAFLVSYFEKKNADIEVKIVAKGKNNPVAANTNEKNRKKNRRVEVWSV